MLRTIPTDNEAFVHDMNLRTSAAYREFVDALDEFNDTLALADICSPFANEIESLRGAPVLS